MDTLETFTAYGFDYATREYTGAIELRTPEDRSPAGDWLIPGNATEIKPPNRAAGKATVWDPAARSWAKVPDHRGETWWTREGERRVVDLPGDPEAMGLVADPIAASFTEEDYRQECARRIVAVASTSTQLNMAAYFAANPPSSKPSAEELASRAAFVDGINWIGAMRARWRELHESGDIAFTEDAKWPEAPPASVALAARF